MLIIDGTEGERKLVYKTAALPTELSRQSAEIRENRQFVAIAGSAKRAMGD